MENDLSLNKELRKLLRYSRISVLALLNFVSMDGLTYNALRENTNLSEGTFGGCLIWLYKNDYIKIVKEKIQKVCFITQKGEDAVNSIIFWFIKIGYGK